MTNKESSIDTTTDQQILEGDIKNTAISYCSNSILQHASPMMRLKYQIETDRDMKYLLAWLQRLTRAELKCLLELQKMENPNHFEALQKYFNLVRSKVDASESDQGELKHEMEKIEESIQPEKESAKRTIPVTRRKS